MKPSRGSWRLVPLSRDALMLLQGGDAGLPVVAYAIRWTPPPAPRSRKKQPAEVVVGLGGLVWHLGRCTLWLDTLDHQHMPTVALVRYAHRMLRLAAQMGETVVYCVRDDTEANSFKLLSLVGLKFVAVEELTLVDGTVKQGELWEWRNSP